MRPGWPSPPRAATGKKEYAAGRLSPTPPHYGSSSPWSESGTQDKPSSAVEDLLARKEHCAALRSALESSSGGNVPRQTVGAPTGESEEAVSIHGEGAARTAILRRVLASVPENQIDGVIGTLSSIEQDALMKGLYGVLADRSAAGSAAALRWHGRLAKVAGLGSIVRVLTDGSGQQA